jgi:hypothetical protein
MDMATRKSQKKLTRRFFFCGADLGAGVGCGAGAVTVCCRRGVAEVVARRRGAGEGDI